MAAISMEKGFLFGCPLAGEVIPISQCSDPTFAQGILGPGVVIQPQGCVVYAPADAIVEFSLSTKHALGMETEAGIKFLIHVGMDTNRLQGKGFEIFVQTGDRVTRGQKVLAFDPAVMADHQCALDTPFVFCNCKEGWEVDLLKTGFVPAGEDLLRLTPLQKTSSS